MRTQFGLSAFSWLLQDNLILIIGTKVVHHVHLGVMIAFDWTCRTGLAFGGLCASDICIAFTIRCSSVVHLINNIREDQSNVRESSGRCRERAPLAVPAPERALLAVVALEASEARPCAFFHILLASTASLARSVRTRFQGPEMMSDSGNMSRCMEMGKWTNGQGGDPVY